MPNKLPNLSALLDSTVWAITSDKFDEIRVLLDRIGPDGLEAADTAEFEAAHQSAVTFANGIAIVPVEGAMIPRANMMMKYSGGTSTEILGRSVMSLADDPKVRGIMLSIDSPGGSVKGLQSLTDAVEYAKARKPMASHTSGAMASAALWLGTSAPKVYASPDSLVGSIGVIARRLDRSAAMEKDGEKEHIFRGGSRKALGQESEPVSEAEREDTQRIVDGMYDRFVSHIATSRGLTEEAVRQTEARLYSADDALKLNLIDGIMDFNTALAALDATATAEEKLAAVEAAMSENAAELAEANRLLAEAASRIEETDARAIAAELAVQTARIDAAVTELTEGECKVPVGKADELRARLTADFEGTMASYALVPKNAARPSNAPALEEAISSDDPRAYAESKGIPIASFASVADVYRASSVEYLDATVDPPVLRNSPAK